MDYQGKYIYLQKDKDGNEIFDLFRYNLITGKTEQLTDGKNTSPSFLCDLSRDGKRLYYSNAVKMWSFSDINVLNTNTLKTSILVKSNNKDTWECESLSDNDERLAIYKFVNNNEIHAGFFDLKSNKLTMFLSEANIQNTNLRFLKDKIYFLSTKDSDNTNLWEYDISKSSLARVNTKTEGSIEEFNFFNEGKISTISYRGQLNGEFKVFDGIFENEKKFKAPLDKDIKFISYSQFNPSQMIAVVANSATPDRYFVVNNESTKLFLDSNQSGIDNNHFAVSDSRLIKSFDGINIPTHFYIPNQASEKSKLPAILFIHGGPEEYFDATYIAIFQYIVNKGFVIVTPNVRGSRGFGKKYMYMDNGDWGGAHIKDILAVAEYTKELNFIDKENIFLAGGSFGGFSVMSLITQYPKVFNAAVCMYGIMEFKTFIDSLSPMAQDYFISELGSDPRKDDNFNKRISPYYHVDNIQIPLMIQHGANDSRIPIKQAEVIVEKLKSNNKEVDFISFPDEGHGFSKFDNSKKSFSEMIAFFKKHTKK